MHKSQKSAKKLPRILLASFSLFLVGCNTLPEKPIVTICIIDYPRQEGICAETTNKTEARDLAIQAIAAAATKRIPLESMDKSVCFSPKEWEKVQNYIDILEDALRRKE